MADSSPDEPHLKRNIIVQLLHGMLGQTGFRIITAPTFMPAYLFSISGSELFVGVARSLEALGQVLTPMLGASLIGHRKRMLGITLTAGVFMRVQMLLIALTGFVLGGTVVQPYAVVLFLTLMGFFQGMQGVLMNSLRAKVVPVGRRGFVSGWRNFLSGITTAGVSLFAGSHFIDQNLWGDGYAALFLLAFAITSAGLAALAFTIEPDSNQLQPRRNFFQSFQGVPEMLRQNTNFARFFVVSALGSFGRMALPFYILYAGTKTDMSGAMLGTLTTIWIITGTASNLAWGYLADRRGFRIVMIATLILWVIAHVELVFASGLTSLVIFFMLVGTANAGFDQARTNLVLELGAVEEIPVRIALSNSAANAIGTIGPLLGGLLALWFGYTVIFVCCLIMQLIAVVMLIGWVKEPRHLPA